jgi:hypothetical protein
VDDATIRAGISCLYEPHANNLQCLYLAHLITDWLDMTPFMTAEQYMQFVLTDFPQACRCSKGFGNDPNYLKVGPRSRLCYSMKRL